LQKLAGKNKNDTGAAFALTEGHKDAAGEASESLPAE